MKNLKIKIRNYIVLRFPVLIVRYSFKKNMRVSLNLKNPKTFNEKICWMKLYYTSNNPLEIYCTDKYAVRNYIIEKKCEKYLNPLLGMWENIKDIIWNELPNRFVLKSNAGSGMNLICTNKDKLNIENVEKILSNWLNTDYGLITTDPHYSKIKRKIICEAYINDETLMSDVPDDYKVHCFHGNPTIICHYTGSGNDIIYTFYDTEWNMLDIGNGKGTVTHKPSCLEELLRLSKILSMDFPYVRIDFYIVKNRIIFGELTFTPANGMSKNLSAEGDLYMGQFLHLNDLYMKDNNMDGSLF